MRRVSALPAGPVPRYATADARVANHPPLELAAVGQDLLESHHLEWPGAAGANVEIRRRLM